MTDWPGWRTVPISSVHGWIPVEPSQMSVIESRTTATVDVLVMTAWNAAPAPVEPVSSSVKVPSPSASFVFCTVIVMTVGGGGGGGGGGGLVTSEVSWALAVFVGLPTSVTVTDAVFTFAPAAD